MKGNFIDFETKKIVLFVNGLILLLLMSALVP